MAAKPVQTRRDQVQLAQPNDLAAASSGISLRLWRLYAQAWLVCLLFPIVYLAQTPQTPVRLSVAIAGLVSFMIAYTWFMWPHPLNTGASFRSTSRTALIALLGVALLVLLLSLICDRVFLWLFIGVSAMIGMALPVRSAFVAVLGLTLLTLGVGVSGSPTETDWLQLLPLVLLVRGLGLDMVGLTRLSEALRELHAARGELARQAATNERLRLARDLHDLLGHTLSMIILKSELAGRVIDKEPARAAQEIHEVERAARQTLHEVREAIASYRQPTLFGELDGARELLGAAGIACTIEHTAGTLPPVTDSVLAWTVREGVTNVIRHSRAQRCTIRIRDDNGQASVEMINDGYHDQQRDPAPAGVGSGLAGLTQRVAAQGGQIEAGPHSSEGNSSFRLWVEIPIRNSEAMMRESQR